MKKSNMLIAVFAVLAAASVAKAGEVKVSFDGGTGGAVIPTLDMDIDQGSMLPIPIEPWTDPMPGVLPYCDGVQMFPWSDFCTETPHMPLNCEQAGSGSWWWTAVCNDEVPVFPVPNIEDFETFARKSAGSRSTANGNVSAFLVSYANAHADFAASVLPALASDKAKVFFDKKGGAYAVNGNTVVRIDLAKLGRQSALVSRLNKIAPVIQGALIVAETVQTWYNVYNTWNEYNSSDNDNGGGSGSYGGNISHQDQIDIQNNVQRGRVR